ncbi:MAG: hypothetical protein HQ592_02620 [Planctomycetes bacterium]|nr:hypothetical protein [Planctomycetota bacterium]
MYLGLLVWVAVATLLSYAVERLWSDFASHRFFHYALAPGIVVHELSHIFGCVLTGAKVGHVVLFGPSGGSVEHSEPKMPLLGQPIISLAPIAGCTLALWGVWWVFSARLGLRPSELPGVELSAAGGIELWQVMRKLFVEAFRQVFSRKLLSLEGAAFVYLVLTFSVSMAPSRTDLRHALLGLVTMGAIIFLAERTFLAHWEVWMELSRRITMFGWKAFTFSIFLLMLALVVSIPAAIAGKLLDRSQ